MIHQKTGETGDTTRVHEDTKTSMGMEEHELEKGDREKTIGLRNTFGNDVEVTFHKNTYYDVKRLPEALFC